MSQIAKVGAAVIIGGVLLYLLLSYTESEAQVYYGPYLCEPVGRGRITQQHRLEDAVTDGDTIRVLCETKQDHFFRVSVRLDGVNTRETRTKCAPEKTAGLAAKQFVLDWFGDARLLTLYDVRQGKFAGRVLGKIRLSDDEPDLATALLAAGHAEPYFGGKRKTLCEENPEQVFLEDNR